MARDRASRRLPVSRSLVEPGRSRTGSTKRSLITISHAIDQAAVAAVATQDEPVVLVAMFQRPPYVDRERVAYRKLAISATPTIVGVWSTPNPMSRPASRASRCTPPTRGPRNGR